MKIYTKTGDKGKTSLLDGKRVNKSHFRLEVYGTIDELNSHIGLIRSSITFQHIIEVLLCIQGNLMSIGSLLAIEEDPSKFSLPDISQSDIEKLEQEIDEMEIHLPPLTNFILPGGSGPVSYIHIARTVCRRAERLVSLLNEENPVNEKILIFLNRLSDYLFVLSRKISFEMKVEEIPWKPRS